jgi:hypothetical protein
MEKNENFKTELENQYSILIRANEKKEHQRYMVLLVIILITFSVCLVSMLFSFKAFSTTKEINDDNQVITNTHNHTLTTMFNNGRTLNISKITNGYELATPKIIQITNEGNSDIIFDIKLSSIKTTLLSTNNLVYTLTRDNSTSDAMSLPLSDKVIVQNLTIEPGETITFTLKVKFTGFLENNNTDNSYNANIIVEQKNNKANLLE